MTEAPASPPRRRDEGWLKQAATFLAQGGVSPSQLSFIGVAFAVLGASSLGLSGLISDWPRVVLLVVGALSIQLRLLCNILENRVAAELVREHRKGAIFSELPDRFADFLLLAGAWYGTVSANFVLGPALGWLAAVLAVIAAYVRELGRGEGLPADFSGPLAKPQRMAVLTAAVLVTCFDGLWTRRGATLMAGLGIIAVLTAVTIGMRAWNHAHALTRRSSEP